MQLVDRLQPRHLLLQLPKKNKKKIKREELGNSLVSRWSEGEAKGEKPKADLRNSGEPSLLRLRGGGALGEEGVLHLQDHLVSPQNEFLPSFYRVFREWTEANLTLVLDGGA